jgi:outer membrane protein assembly factor BamB
MIRIPMFSVLALMLLMNSGRAADPAPQSFGWRGDTSGRYPDAKPPTTWSIEKNLKWRLKVGASNSAPVVAGDKVLLMAEPDKLLCLERATGQLLWEQTSAMADLAPAARPAEAPHYETSCGYTTPTPVCDGKVVYVLLGNGIVASYTLSGQRNWITWLPAEQTSPYGRSSSPILAGDVLIAPMSHLHGIDRKTGKLLWEAKGVESAYGTPVVVDLSGTAMVITPGGFAVRASDGKVLAKDLGSLMYGSPVAEGNTVYFVGPELTAVKLSLAGDKVSVKRLFDENLDGEYMASPVLHDGLLFTITTSAIYVVIDAKTGKPVFEPRTLELLPAGDPKTGAPTVYPSPTLAGGMLYLSNTGGETFVLRAGKAYEEISRNRLPSGCPACPVFAGGQMFLRGETELYCIGP